MGLPRPGLFAPILLALSGCSGETDELRAGREAFLAAGCASCHRVGGLGGNTGPDLTLVGVRRGAEWLDLWLKDPRAWKSDALMPNLRLADGERKAVVRYLSSLKGEAGWTAAADAAEPGRAVYRRAGCVACHGPNGSGGHPNNNVPGGAIPALDKLAATYTLEELEKRIRAGSNPVKADPAGPEPLVRMPAWAGALSDDEVRAVASYVMTLASEPTEAW